VATANDMAAIDPSDFVIFMAAPSVL
jgi:hypothetical protein